MKARRFKCPQIRVQCTNCKTIFIRYNYGKGRRRSRRWGKTRRRRGNPYADQSHASITDSCILCRGRIVSVYTD